MLRLDHLVFPIWDVPASLDFYAGTLGLPLSAALTGENWGGKPWLMLIFTLAEGRELVLVALRGSQPPADDGLPADTRHYAFSVATRQDQDAWAAKLTDAGIEVTEEDHGDQQSIYFSDPNGVVLEITTPPSRPSSHADPAAMRRAREWIEQSHALTA